MAGIGTGRSCNGGGITMTNRTAQRQQLRVQPVPQSATVRHDYRKTPRLFKRTPFIYIYNLPAIAQEDGGGRSDMLGLIFRKREAEAIAVRCPTPARAGVTAGGAGKQGPFHHPLDLRYAHRLWI